MTRHHVPVPHVPQLRLGGGVGADGGAALVLVQRAARGEAAAADRLLEVDHAFIADPFPALVRVEQLLQCDGRATRNKVQLADAGAYYLTKVPRNEFVLGFSVLGERAIREGVKRIAR